MATLFIRVLDPQINQREFNCGLDSIEASFDFLNHIVAHGHTLLRAYLVEDSIRTDLPIDAFDGLPMTLGIQALEDQWKVILSSKSSLSGSAHQELIELTRRRMDLYEGNIKVHKRMIDWYRIWLDRIQERDLVDPTRTNYSQLYEHHLLAHQTQLVKAHFGAKLLTNRLSQLIA